VTPDALAGGRRLDDADARGRLAAAWGTSVNADRGIGAEEMLGQTPGLVIAGDALAGGVPAAGSLKDVLAGSELVVVLDSYASAVLEVADVVLPVATAVEAAGTATCAEGRVQRVRGCVAPPGEARGAWWVLGELGRRLGLGGGVNSPDEVLDEITAVVPGYQTVDRDALDRGWGCCCRWPGRFRDLSAFGPPMPPSDERTVVVDGVYDWERSAGRASPILCRDRALPEALPAWPGGDGSGRRRRPRRPPGMAGQVGVESWRVVLPLVLRHDLAPGG
jgi:hypothetical protein